MAHFRTLFFTAEVFREAVVGDLSQKRHDKSKQDCGMTAVFYPLLDGQVW